jgi:hypothetical protein
MSHIAGMGHLTLLTLPPNRPLATANAVHPGDASGAPYGRQAGARVAEEEVRERLPAGGSRALSRLAEPPPERARPAPRKRRGMPRYRFRKTAKRCPGEPYAMTRKASGTERNLTHSCSPMYSPSTWNATGRLDLRISSG